MRKLSVIIPCRDEESVISQTYGRLDSVFQGAAYPVELVFIDDGSRDRTFSRLKEIARADPRVSVIRLSRNFGYQAAVAAGLRYCTGTEAVVMNADLRDPPEEIPRMLELMDGERCNVVYGQRDRRNEEGALKELAVHAWYRFLAWLSDVKLPLGAGDFRILDRAVIDAFNSLPERNKYIRGLIGWIGFKQAVYRYAPDPRAAGRSKHTASKIFERATRGLVSFSRKPLRLATRAGLAGVAVAFGLAVWAVVRKLAFAGETIPGWASTVTILLFLGGLQLLCTGMLGAYIGSIFDESKRRPEYIVAELVTRGAAECPLSAVLQAGEGRMRA